MNNQQQIFKEKIENKIIEYLNDPDNTQSDYFTNRVTGGKIGYTTNIKYDTVNFRVDPVFISNPNKPHIYSSISGSVNIGAKLTSEYSDGNLGFKTGDFTATFTANINPDTGDIEDLVIK